MQEPSSFQEIDLTPLPGKTYFSRTREWREEFIYFLLVDRFHDGAVRAPVRQSGRSQGAATDTDGVWPRQSYRTRAIRIRAGRSFR
jgi:hypothetical protein